MTIPTITVLPTPPTTGDPNFAADADAFMSALPTFQAQTNAAIAVMNATAAYTPNINRYVDVVATSNIVIASGLVAGTVIDGVTLTAGQRVLLTAQSTASECGVYDVAASGAASRSFDSNSAALLQAGLQIVALSGTARAHSIWMHTTAAGFTLGTTALTFTQIGAPLIGGVMSWAAQQIITSNSAAALAVGPNGSTNPAFQVDGSASSLACGVLITGKASGFIGPAISVISSATNESITIDAKGSGAVIFAGTSTGGTQFGNASATAGAKFVGPVATALRVMGSGAGQPQLQVDCSASSVATGFLITGAAAGAGIALAAISSGSAEKLSIDAKGTGIILIGGTSTGDVFLGAGSLHVRTSKILAIGATVTGNSLTNLGVNAFAALQFTDNNSGNGNGQIVADNTNNIVFVQNAYYNGSNVYAYSQSGAASQYIMGASGTHQWLRAASGTGNATITFAEAMRIDTNGFLLVGYTSSNGAFKLQVNSQIFATSATISTSDARLKDILREGVNDNDADAIFALPSIIYSRKDRPQDGIRAGYRAQDWQALTQTHLPHLGIVTENGGMLALDEGSASILKIAALESKCRRYEWRINELERRAA